VKEAAVVKRAAEAAAMEKAVAIKVAAEKGATDRAAADKNATDKAAADKATIEEATADRATMGKVVTNERAAEEVNAKKIVAVGSVEKPTMESAVLDPTIALVARSKRVATQSDSTPS
jgi:hypothetical protein